MLLLREVLDPKYGMFVYNEESRLMWFNAQVIVTLYVMCLLRFVGREAYAPLVSCQFIVFLLTTAEAGQGSKDLSLIHI